MIFIIAISQLYFFYFMSRIFEEIEIRDTRHTVLIVLSTGINFLFIVYSLFFIYLR
jgi:hypothetical protein